MNLCPKCLRWWNEGGYVTVVTPEMRQAARDEVCGECRRAELVKAGQGQFEL